MKKYFIRYRRYVIFFFNYIFKECMRGLDFSMRDKHLLKATNGKMHGYSIAPKGILNKIFKELLIKNNDMFIDIGCGKGFVLWHASNYNFKKILGIDIDENLIRIANRNIDKLKLEKVEAIYANALDFNSYLDYNYFFLSNPFSLEIFKSVFDNIILSLKNSPRKITVIYYNPTCADYIDSTGEFILKKTLYCNIKDYYAHIYENKFYE